MNCNDFRDQYTTYRDGHDPELAAEMDDHIETCPDCAIWDRAVREGVEVLRAEQIVPSADFQSRLEARLATDAPVPEPLPPQVPTAAAGLGAVLVLVLIGLTVRELMVAPSPAAAEEPPLVLAHGRLIPGIPFVVFERADP